ncbi:unnamed protein product [Ceutorhynchus assimilis]|uniref:Laminin G domain-containing protein n=1 Tax=Ceutorhynchus assimilis TaxID=467358 RepID=A0A9N9QPK6_9CUCU|nr:unnamed protein product [Ceutorhynchus assimilis]
MALNINDYNVVSLTFKTDLISLSVNEEDEIIYRKQTGSIFKENLVDIVIGSIEGFDSFYGGISDISLNNEKLLFDFNTVKEFSNVEIGRENPLVRPSITLKSYNPIFINMTNTMQNTQGCSTTANYITDPTAVNFGDQPDSFIKIQTSFWKKDFKFEFDFRTLYPNGMLFISVGSSSIPPYTYLEIKDGKLTYHVKNKRKIPKKWPLMFTKKVNDGQWHSIRIVKKNGKKLIMSLDNETKKPVRVPKIGLKEEIYFGSVPKDYVTSKELNDRLQPFRGCINNLQINEDSKLLGKNTNDVSYSNIRQISIMRDLFWLVIRGQEELVSQTFSSREGFRINSILDLSFEFRTAEQNGILLTVSNEGNYPALSIELQNGAVVMTVDLGNGVQTNVTNNLDSDFALCDNMWHNVTAMYSSSELTVNVDGIRKSWVQSDVNSLMDEIDAPLYVGGLPDNAAVGTLKTRENFKGCIRNLKIENDPKDWSEMDELNSVLLNSCPVVPVSKS